MNTKKLSFSICAILFSSTLFAATNSSDQTNNNGAVQSESTVYMKQSYATGFQDTSFVVANVVLDGDKIIDAKINELLYVAKSDNWIAVPNSDAGFGKSYPDNKILVSKYENSDSYTAMMKQYANPTNTWKQNIDAITAFVKNKNITEIEKTIEQLKVAGANPVDSVTGATLVETKNYLQAVVDSAKSELQSEGLKTSNVDLSENMIFSKPHGDKSFAVVTVAMDNDKIATVLIDEFQYVDPKDFAGLPNSDKAFGKGVKNNAVLISKLANNTAYSKSMADHAKATRTWQQNVESIINFAKGKTITELEAAVTNIAPKNKGIDATTGATFVDTKGYLQAIIDAAKAK